MNDGYPIEGGKGSRPYGYGVEYGVGGIAGAAGVEGGGGGGGAVGIEGGGAATLMAVFLSATLALK
jgi:hypothetical protein